MNFPSKSAGEESEYIQCVVADIFLRRLIIDLHSLNFVLVAFVAVVFFWVAREGIVDAMSMVPCSGCLPQPSRASVVQHNPVNCCFLDKPMYLRQVKKRPRSAR